MINSKATQAKGFITLTVTLIILIIIIFASLLTGRILLGDQRIAANELRYREAMANAEQGIETALATIAVHGVATLPVPGMPANVSMTQGTLTLGSGTLPLLTLISNGISLGVSEGVATIRQQAIITRVTAGTPDAPLTVAGGMAVSGNFMVVANPNGGGRGVPLSIWTDQYVDLTNGSGSTCGQQEWVNGSCGTATYSEQGNKQADILDSDPLFPADLLLYIFGVPDTAAGMATLETRAKAILTSCNTLNSNSTGFYIVDGACNPSGTVGSQNNPVVLLVRNGDITMNGNMNIYGLVFTYDSAPATAPNYDVKLNGGATVHGALVANHQVGTTNGTYNAVYDADALSNIQNGQQFAIVAKIPGSWKDW